MKQVFRVFWGCTLAAALALTGCGRGGAPGSSGAGSMSGSGSGAMSGGTAGQEQAWRTGLGVVTEAAGSDRAGKITTAGQEIADWLSTETGLSFKIEVGTSFAASIEAMGANKAQIGFLNTFSVLLAESKYGIEPALAVVRKLAVNDISPDVVS